MITATIKLTIEIINMTEKEARKRLTELMESRELEDSFECTHMHSSDITSYEVTDDTPPTFIIGTIV